eukprot:3824602-Pleurochrysis_carterae.AAC.1
MLSFNVAAVSTRKAALVRAVPRLAPQQIVMACLPPPLPLPCSSAVCSAEGLRWQSKQATSPAGRTDDATIRRGAAPAASSARSSGARQF